MTVILRRAVLIFATTACLIATFINRPARAGGDAADDLYRRRGYGIGGPMFGLGQGGTAQAGACADLRFAQPAACGRGIGVYGNGLGYGFGF